MARVSPEKLLIAISQAGPRYLPCPERKDHAQIAVDVCRSRCKHARRCSVFQAWLRPPLNFDGP